jgi:Zn-dependent metalloprotease
MAGETFHRVYFNAVDQPAESDEPRLAAVRGGGRGTEAARAREFTSDEVAARFYLGALLGRDARPAMRSLTAPERAYAVPDLRVQDAELSPLTNTRTVRFEQTKASIPVFGSRAVVEMDRNRELIGVEAHLAEVGNVSPNPSLTAAQAIERVAAFTGATVEQAQRGTTPELTFYRDEDADAWHLAYLCRNVPAAPAGFMQSARSHGIGRSPSARHPVLDYLVDAHNGAILLHYSASPTALPIPVLCHGTDEDGQAQQFFGRLNEARFEMSDPLRRISTFDFGLGDIDSAPHPTIPVAGSTGEFGAAQTAAVSAHANAVRVYEFYRSVLMRDSIDGKGMEIVSFVNCTAPAEEPEPEWHNASWWQGRMWYGQVKKGEGFQSFARYLDVIAHELTHGVTQSTADLIYLKESGALNESFSDIFGVLIKNWDFAPDRHGGSVADWCWEIGHGLGKEGLPLRDFSDPTRTGDPAHMNKYVVTTDDHGGVHTNSGIHNKAAHNLLTARWPDGGAVFTPRDVAVFYYLCLTRLEKVATFKRTLEVLLNVAGSYLAGDTRRAAKLATITQAYNDVGIA